MRLGPWAKDETGHARPLLRRHGFWVLVGAAALYLPVLGITTLWDPWESEYAEVARGMLGRDDWISPWFVQEGWFLSKPVLNFWIQAISMATLGTHYQAGTMLLDASGRPTLHPEWAVRAPTVLLAIFALYFLYKGVAKAYGRRAGLLGALVLATMPDWYFISHQTMADMPCVAPMTAAMGLLLLGMTTHESTLARVYEVRVGKAAWRLSGWHLVFGAILLTALPQILYLFSRNLELVLGGSGPHGFRVRWDELMSGSRGSCSTPGNEACLVTSPASLPKGLAAHPDGLGPSLHRLFGAFEPVLQGLLWSSLVGFTLWLNWGERRLQRLFYLGAWYCASVATMGKGPEGIVLPAASALVWILARRRWRELARIEILSGVLIWVALVFPWFVAMYVRHGSVFTDRLIFQDMFNRALGHIHDTNEGEDTSIRFYLWQLGYAFFPWTGLVPLGLLYWVRASAKSSVGAVSDTSDVAIVLFLWFLFTFALMSFMGTKFHHYIFPAVPPVAMLVGIALDRMLGLRGRRDEKRGPLGPQESHERVMFGAAAVGGALLVVLVGRDLILKPAGSDQPGAIRLLQLFTYQYKRSWPDSLDFTTSLTVITITAVVVTLALVSWRWRREAIYAFGALAFACALWGLDVYMVKTSSHWGQHEIIQAYYADRSSADEPLVAYQMNWKGENFYTGNRAAVFVSTGAPLASWLKSQRESGVKVMYFVAEHWRLGGLKGEVKAKSYREITDKTLNDKFVVVRAEL